ncbi:hypothetical protein BGZ93_006492 [Podila epicladia]|nr:hypothetical protein BGZ93_006492 [Podila epicladia]
MSEEILLEILAFVHCHKSINRVGATCRRLWRIAHDPYLWKYVTLDHDIPLRRHWEHRVKPLLLSNSIQELTLLGEIPPPVYIYALSLDDFSTLQALRLEDIQTYSVYVLVRSLPWLRVFEARKIKGSSSESSWDWRPFQHLTQLEELLLWRNEEETASVKTFSLSAAAQHGTDEIYPFDLIQAATDALGPEPGSIAAFMGMTNESFDFFVSDVEEIGFQHHEGEEEEDDDDDDESDNDSAGSGAQTIQVVDQTDSDTSGGSNQSYITTSTATASTTTHDREVFLPRLRKLALINIGSPTTHRGTDAVIRKLVSRVHSFIYGNSFNILFPVLRTNYSQLRHLCLLEPSGPAWKNGTWQNHVNVFSGMVRLETLTLVNPNMSRKFMLPILDAVLALETLSLVHVVALEQDIENVDAIFLQVVTSKWNSSSSSSSGGSNRRLKISLKDDRHEMYHRAMSRRGLLHRMWKDVEGTSVDDSVSSSTSRNSSSSSAQKKGKGSLSSMRLAEEIRSNEEWCDWARERAKVAGHVVVGCLSPREEKGKGKDESTSSSLSGGRPSGLSVEIEMVSSWQAYDNGLSQVCMEAWQAH